MRISVCGWAVECGRGPHAKTSAQSSPPQAKNFQAFLLHFAAATMIFIGKRLYSHTTPSGVLTAPPPWAWRIR